MSENPTAGLDLAGLLDAISARMQAVVADRCGALEADIAGLRHQLAALQLQLHDAQQRLEEVVGDQVGDLRQEVADSNEIRREEAAERKQEAKAAGDAEAWGAYATDL